MLFRAAFQLGFTAAVALGHNIRAPHRHCGSPEASVAAALDGLATGGSFRTTDDGEPEPVEVDVYFHVVSTSTSPSDGYLSNATIGEQLAVLNADYADSSFSFVHRETTYTVNETWALYEDVLGMKSALRQGCYRDLNVYFLTQVDDFLGIATFPLPNVTEGTQEFLEDGVIVLHSTTPGGAEENYNLGKTTTHEVGHWLGLFHTFEGGCDEPGDRVSDTPAELEPAVGCTPRDSCPGSPGLDPIENYMDYSWDSCMTGFTEGQIDVVRSVWYQTRDK